MHDLRFVIRSLIQSPGFTTVAVVSLALAFGANSAVLALLNALFFRPLIPLRPEEVVTVFTARATSERSYRAFAWNEYSFLREADGVFAQVAAFRPVVVGVGERSETGMRRVFGFLTSDNYFATFGAVPALGRFFRPEEAQANADVPVVVVSQAMWQRMGGGNDCDGRTLMINGSPWTVVGVAPAGFSAGNTALAPDLWLPLGVASRMTEAFGTGTEKRGLAAPDNFSLFVFGRLQAGLSFEAAAVRLPALASQLTTIAADAPRGARTLELGRPSRFNISTEPSSDGPLAIFGALLLGMAGVVYGLKAFAVARRTREFGIRFALGARARHVLGPVLRQGAVQIAVGLGLGVLLALACGRLLASMLLRVSPYDPLILVAAALPLAVAALLATWLPARRATRIDPMEALRAE
jgi:putative ABC transport system permease protein